MSAESPEQWLARDVEAELGVARVGLYELIWSLSGTDFKLDDSEKWAIAVQVARDVMRSGRALLCAIRWPTDEVLAGPFDEDILEEQGSFSGGARRAVSGSHADMSHLQTRNDGPPSRPLGEGALLVGK